MEVIIDKNSGYCFGVEYAIEMAEDELNESGELYCLGDIVHNAMEVNRLLNKGLKVISKEEYFTLSNCKVLIRAHGEPPQTYQYALDNHITLIDASCPVVLKLQNRVKTAFDDVEKQKGQVVIYGQQGHAEVLGLVGQTNDKAIVVTTEEDLEKVDFSKPISFFSQTTKSTAGFYKMKDLIEDRMKLSNPDFDKDTFDANDSICRQVSNREPQLEKFSKENEVIVFVSGKKSSNGKALYSVCKLNNPQSYFVENEQEIEESWFENVQKVGIAGATSTPSWLMEDVKNHILKISEKNKV
ncbi:MAG: 4-hydroxy-3-methylbut-2-enyl diphosphate reductase [Cytophagales bacterium]